MNFIPDLLQLNGLRKRRALWIIGVTAVLVTGIAVTVSWVSRKSPDGRLEGTLAQIIEDYDFGGDFLQDVQIDYYGFGGSDVTSERYRSNAVSYLDIEQIDKLIRAACSGCTASGPRYPSEGTVSYSYEAGDERRSVVSITLSGNTALQEWPGFDLKEKGMGWIVVQRRNPPGFWEKVASWIPW